jgi:hypothetical protein
LCGDELLQDVLFGEGTLVFGKDAIAFEQGRGVQLILGSKQADVEVVEFEGVVLRTCS